MNLLDDQRGRKQDEIVADILRYFLRNPLAADSFDGIARWRIMDELVRRSLGDTEQALRWLIASGYLQEQPVPGGKAVYVLNPHRREEASLVVESIQRSERGYEA